MVERIKRRNIGVVQPAKTLRLGKKAPNPLWVASQLGAQEFDRDVPPDLGV
jgi:hypothetical protein